MNSRTKNRILIIASAVLVCLFSACGKEPSLIGYGKDAEVNFTSRFELQSKASGASWAAGDKIGIRMIDAVQATVAGYTNRLYTANASAGLSPATNNAMYYPVSSNVGFVAYYPYDAALSASAYTANIATQSTPANIDLLWAKTPTTDYNKASGTVPLTFSHQLSKMVLNTKPDKGLTDLSGLTITIKGMKTKNTFDILNGTWGTANTVSNITAYKVTEGVLHEAMLLPETVAQGTVTIDFVVKGKTYTWAFPATTFQAKHKHEWTVTISDLDITVSAATITPWAETVVDENVGKLRIGDYKSGGIVYWIDPTDATKYKVVSLTQTRVLWSSQTTYVLGSVGQSDIDGKSNVAAMKAYSVAHTGDADNTTKTTGDFAIDFPAAEFCDNIGVGWYLPARDELMALYGAYQIEENKNTIDAGLTESGGVAFPVESDFWSSTENSSTDTWYVNFSYGTPGYSSKGNRGLVRCIRYITPPPAVGDYYYSDGSYSTDLKASKTVTGLIYWIDPTDATKYKVVSLAETQVIWSAKDTYVLGATGQSDTDGKSNIAAVKAYSQANITNADETKKTTGDFAIDFPAANVCDKMGDGWYLPAKTDLQHLWCAYNGKAPISWDSATNPDAAADEAAQAVFKSYLTKAGGVSFGYSFWSSTEYSNKTDYTWRVNFDNGFTDGSKATDKNRFVRCFRDN